MLLKLSVLKDQFLFQDLVDRYFLEYSKVTQEKEIKTLKIYKIGTLTYF